MPVPSFIAITLRTPLRLLVFLCLAAAIYAGPDLAQAGAQNPQGGTAAAQNKTGGFEPGQDVNKWTLKLNEDNYGKRFPFAKFHREADRVINGESQPGGSLNVSDPAYASVEVKCDFFSDKGSLGRQHLHYKQNQEQVSGELASQRDTAVSKGALKTLGMPVSDTTLQLIDRENRQRLLELFFDPERWMWKDTTTEQLKSVSVANSTGGAAEATFQASFDTIKESLINVANERAAVPTSGKGGGQQSYGEAIYIIQQLYKTIFIPMALLLLLPGAVMTQMKGMVTHGFLGGDEDSASPLTGIIRAIIAIFLIPATQLIVSYCIDVGNALAGEVSNPTRGWIQDATVRNWASEQMYTPPVGNVANAIRTAGGAANTSEGSGPNPPVPTGGTAADQAVDQGLAQGTRGQGQGGFDFSAILGVSPNNPGAQIINGLLNFLFGGAQPPGQNVIAAAEGQGKSAGQLEDQTLSENTLWLSGAMQAGFNTSANVMASALMVLTQYQLVFMCYLFLLGPIAAALYAWPSGIGTLFNKVFSNWVDAVLVLALWRFWWCVILAVMTQRIVFLQPNPGTPAEMMVFNCFMALLLYIPFQPFNFHPGPIVSNVLEKAGAGGAGGAGATKPTVPTSPSGPNTTPVTPTPTNVPQAPTQPNTSGKGGGDDKGPGKTKQDGGGGKGDGSTSLPPQADPGKTGVNPPGPSPPTPTAPANPTAAPPPVTSPVMNLAAATLQALFPGINVSSILKGMPPTVALAPQGGPGLLVTTGKPSEAQKGANAVKNVANTATTPSFLQGGTTVQPGKTGSTSGGKGPAPGDTVKPQTPGAASKTNVNINVNASVPPGQPGGEKSGGKPPQPQVPPPIPPLPPSPPDPPPKS